MRAVLTKFGYVPPPHLHPFVVGEVAFEGVWQRRVMADLGAVKAPFASHKDLILMKRAAGRPRDLEDLKQLEKLAKG